MICCNKTSFEDSGDVKVGSEKGDRSGDRKSKFGGRQRWTETKGSKIACLEVSRKGTSGAVALSARQNFVPTQNSKTAVGNWPDYCHYRLIIQLTMSTYKSSRAKEAMGTKSHPCRPNARTRVTSL